MTATPRGRWREALSGPVEQRGEEVIVVAIAGAAAAAVEVDDEEEKEKARIFLVGFASRSQKRMQVRERLSVCGKFEAR